MQSENYFSKSDALSTEFQTNEKPTESNHMMIMYYVHFILNFWPKCDWPHFPHTCKFFHSPHFLFHILHLTRGKYLHLFFFFGRQTNSIKFKWMLLIHNFKWILGYLNLKLCNCWFWMMILDLFSIMFFNPF